MSDIERNALRAWRESRYLSMHELAEKAGLSVQTIWSIENGKRNKVAYRTLRGLAAALDIEPSQIIVTPNASAPKAEAAA